MFNTNHVGDHIFNLKFFFNIAPILKQESIHINYYFKPTNFVKELVRYTNPDVVTLVPTTAFHTIPQPAHNLWMGHSKNGMIFESFFDVYFREYYKCILSILQLDKHNISCDIYQPEEYLLDVYNGLDDKYKNLDILILNNLPQSGQFNYDKTQMDDLCLFLHSLFNVAVSTYINDDIKCTEKDNLTIQDIGAIATHCKYVVGVHSGPMVGCYNSLAKAHVMKWFQLHHRKMIHIETNCVDTSNLEIVKTFFSQI